MAASRITYLNDVEQRFIHEKVLEVLAEEAWERAQAMIAANEVPPLDDGVRRHVRVLIDACVAGR